jgi:hypothetical protein
MLHFKGTELLPVLSEAVIHNCQVIFVKDQGVYLISETGDFDKKAGRKKHIAYAQGCNPNVDEFDHWWEKASSEVGGDDCAEYFNVKDDVFQLVLAGGHDLHIELSESDIQLRAVPLAS